VQPPSVILLPVCGVLDVPTGFLGAAEEALDVHLRP
jgi:hypothetical protein